MSTIRCGWLFYFSVLSLSKYSLAFWFSISRQYVAVALLTLFVVGAIVATPTAHAQADDIEEVVIQAEYVPDEKLATSEVADLLDAETMSIAGDSDLGGALKRVPGLSLVGGKFIYVRGLGERYSATYFNGTLMPSPEPLQRAVPLDLFDTSITKDVLVQKTHSSNYGIEFSGGAVDIRSAAIPDNSFFKIKVSTGYNDISTGKEGLTSKGGSRDWLGTDDGSRALPNGINQHLDSYPNIFGNGGLPSPDQDAARLSFSNNDWDPRRSSNPYDYSLSLGGGSRYQINERMDIGFIAVASLSNQWRNRTTENTSYVPDDALANLGALTRNIDQIREVGLYSQLPEVDDIDGSGPFSFQNGGILTIEDEERTQRRIKSNTLISVGSVIDQAHFINVTNLIARNTTDTVSEQAFSRFAPDLDFRRNTLIDFVENEIDFKQLSGEHILDFANIKWRYALVDALRDNLDSKEDSRQSQNPGDPFVLSTRSGETEPSRSFSFLDDTTRDYGIDIELPFTSDRQFATEFSLKFGASFLEQKRQFQGLQFDYLVHRLVAEGDVANPVLALPFSQLADSSSCIVGEAAPVDPVTVDTECFLAADFDESLFNIPVGTIVIEDGSASGTDDFYAGTSRLEAQYIVIDMQVLEALRFNAGVRRERSLIEVRDSDGDLYRLADDFAEIRETDQNASFSLTWDVYRNMIVRAAYSQTVNRPILRELAPVRLFNPSDGRFYIGNSALRTAQIENFDLRYEIYFGENDYFGVSAFKKRIDNPIEIFARETTEEIIAFRWENSELAVNEGYELELRKYITPELYVTSNATFIDSDVKDRAENLNLLRRSNISERPLTGVSKELYNFQVVYDARLLQASLSYNKYSRRVDSLLVSPVGSTFSLVVEEPFTSVDANVKLKLPVGYSTVNIGFKVSNILDESIERNVLNLGGLPFEHYDVGQTYGLSVEWKQ